MEQVFKAIDAVPAGWFFVVWLVVMLAVHFGGKAFDRRQPRRGAR